MKQGHFYFITDQFYFDHDANRSLMQNKEMVAGMQHDRPCFFAYEDKKEPNNLWCVPISSKIKKYEDIYNKKLEKQRLKGINFPKCNSIRFGEVMGRKKAFLIQNIFPVTYDYILSAYIDKNTKKEVTISPQTQKDIISNAHDIVKLAFHGINLTFADITEIYSELITQLAQTKQQKKLHLPTKILTTMPIVERIEASQVEANHQNAALPKKYLQTKDHSNEDK